MPCVSLFAAQKPRAVLKGSDSGGRTRSGKLLKDFNRRVPQKKIVNKDRWPLLAAVNTGIRFRLRRQITRWHYGCEFNTVPRPKRRIPERHPACPDTFHPRPRSPRRVLARGLRTRNCTRMRRAFVSRDAVLCIVGMALTGKANVYLST